MKDEVELQLIAYLEFEGEFIQDELEAFELSGSLTDQNKVIHKRLEAKTAWEKAGHTVPSGISFTRV